MANETERNVGCTGPASLAVPMAIDTEQQLPNNRPSSNESHLNESNLSALLSQKEGRALRVLFAVDSKFPGLGGAEHQAVKLAIALRDRGVEVVFVTPRVLKSQPLEEIHQGFKVSRIDYPHIRWLGSFALMFSFGRYLTKHASNFDVVHIHITHLLAAAAGFVRSRSHLPVITKISGFYEFEGGVLDPRAKYKPLNFLLRRGLAKVDFVQTISEQTREKLLDAGFNDEQIQFIPNGIDLQQEPIDVPDDEVVRIGYCGRLRSIKGVHILLDGFAKLKQAHPLQSMRLVIAGSGDTQDALNQQASELGIENDIDWLGTITDTRGFLDSINIYVQPSFAEGLPNSVMEAMAAQRPVVVSNIPGNTDLVEHELSGLLFQAGDSTALCNQLSIVLEQPELRQSMAARGRKLMIDRYGFESITRQLADVYRGQ